MKPTSCVIGPGEPILLPSVCAEDEGDYECDLVAVVGKTARRGGARTHVLPVPEPAALPLSYPTRTGYIGGSGSGYKVSLILAGITVEPTQHGGQFR